MLAAGSPYLPDAPSYVPPADAADWLSDAGRCELAAVPPLLARLEREAPGTNCRVAVSFGVSRLADGTVHFDRRPGWELTAWRGAESVQRQRARLGTAGRLLCGPVRRGGKGGDAMRSAPNERVEKFRTGGPAGTNYGAFRVLCRGQWLNVIASCGGGWDHVSVSRPDRCPTWGEMDWVKRQFFHDDETAVQYHVHTGQKINNHPYCLHLWRPQTVEEASRVQAEWAASGEPLPEWMTGESPGEIPMPPMEFVGLPELNPA
jgi:hypothetical protein